MLKHMCVVFLSLTQVAVLGVAVDQSEMSLTKTAGKSAFISCRVSGLARGNYVHWYQKKEGESFTRILYVKEDGTDLTNGPNHPKEDFTVKVNRRSNAYDLKLETLKKSHSAVYYCACWDTSSENWIKVFGSGTKLVVTDEKIKKPVVSAYQISSQSNGKSTLLCQASGMFPDLVRFTWTRSEGQSVPESDDELLEQTDTGRVTSMLIINQQKATVNDYTCQVQHETKDQIVAVPDKVTGIEETVKGPSPTCPPHQVQNQTEGSSGSTQSLYLFRLTYAVLLVKNVLYFCSVSVLLYKRNAWSKEPPHE